MMRPARTGSQPAYGYYTLEEVATELGCSIATAHAIERSALRKLRDYYDERGIRLEDLLPDDRASWDDRLINTDIEDSTSDP